MPATGPSPKLRRMQWIAIILVTAAIALNYMDRSTLAIGNLKIREEFGINATAIGALGSAWALTYGIAQLPSGYLLDRIGPKEEFDRASWLQGGPEPYLPAKPNSDWPVRAPRIGGTPPADDADYTETSLARAYTADLANDL